jgi:hypothetical protein
MVIYRGLQVRVVTPKVPPQKAMPIMAPTPFNPIKLKEPTR